MTFCCRCGKRVLEAAPFCAACGASLATPNVAVTSEPSAAAPEVTHVGQSRATVSKQKHAGWLTVRAIALLGVTALICSAVAGKTADPASKAVGPLIAFGVAIAYIVSNLRNWKRQKFVIEGEATARLCLLLFSLGCIGTFTTIVKMQASSGVASSEANSRSSQAESSLREKSQSGGSPLPVVNSTTAAARGAALRTVTKIEDHAEQVEFFYPRPRPLGGLYVYIGRNTIDSSKYLRLFVRTYATETFYPDELDFLVDGQRLTKALSPFRDAQIDPNPEGDGAVQIDVGMEDSLLRKVLSGNEVYVSLKNDGLSRRTSFKMTAAERKSLEHMISVYDLL